jgi:TPR repeat protein
MVNLGYFYATRKGGLAKDDVLAMEWYRKSALAGDEAGMNNLGLTYHNGAAGLDKVQALSWFPKSSNEGFRTPCTSRGLFTRKGWRRKTSPKQWSGFAKALMPSKHAMKRAALLL